MADILEQLVAPPGQIGKTRHVLLQRRGTLHKTGYRPRALGKRIGVLRRATQHRTIRRHRTLAHRSNPGFGYQAAQCIVADRLDFGDLVRGPKPSKNAGSAPRLSVAHAPGQQSPGLPAPIRHTAAQTRRAACHHIGVIAKIDSAWVATVRAATCKTIGRSSPAILNMLESSAKDPAKR